MFNYSIGPGKIHRGEFRGGGVLRTHQQGEVTVDSLKSDMLYSLNDLGEFV